MPCGEKLVSWRKRAGSTKCRACQEWRNWEYNGDKVRCDCISGGAPGRFKACAPVEFAAYRGAGNEAKRLKRKNAGGLSVAEAVRMRGARQKFS